MPSAHISRFAAVAFVVGDHSQFTRHGTPFRRPGLGQFSVFESKWLLHITWHGLMRVLFFFEQTSYKFNCSVY